MGSVILLTVLTRSSGFEGLPGHVPPVNDTLRAERGLVMAAAKDGATNWLLDDDAARFKERTTALFLGRESHAADDEKQDRETLREPLAVWRQQHDTAIDEVHTAAPEAEEDETLRWVDARMDQQAQHLAQDVILTATSTGTICRS